MLGSAPDLDAAFKQASDREAARTFMDLLAAAATAEAPPPPWLYIKSVGNWMKGRFGANSCPLTKELVGKLPFHPRPTPTGKRWKHAVA